VNGANPLAARRELWLYERMLDRKAWSLLVCACACGSDDPDRSRRGEPDACVRCAEAGLTDAASMDASAADAGLPDAVVVDARSAATDGGSDACEPFPTFARDCKTATDCALAFRTLDCCGSLLATGVRSDQLAAFQDKVTSCSPHAVVCDCIAAAPRADDGTRDDYSNAVVPRVSCLNDQCTSSYARP
jgi:hypothetical protein